MRFYQLPEYPEALIFDMDNTLYTNDAYALHQEEVLIRKLGETLRSDPDTMRATVHSWRENYAREHGGRRPSLGNTFLHGFGIPIDVSVQWRIDYIKPESFLSPDRKLHALLQNMQGRFKLAIVTNNPVRTAERTLETLTVLPFFKTVIGLDSMGKSKPNPDAFKTAAQRLGCKESVCISIGDRFEIDIEPALAIGMGGILVDSVEDVYQIDFTLQGDR